MDFSIFTKYFTSDNIHLSNRYSCKIVVNDRPERGVLSAIFIPKTDKGAQPRLNHEVLVVNEHGGCDYFELDEVTLIPLMSNDRMGIREVWSEI